MAFGELSGNETWLNELVIFSNLFTMVLGKIFDEFFISMPDLRRWIKIEGNVIGSKGLAIKMNLMGGAPPIMLVKRITKIESLPDYPVNQPKIVSTWDYRAVAIGFKILIGLLISSIFMHGCHAGTNEDEELKATIIPLSQILKP